MMTSRSACPMSPCMHEIVKSFSCNTQREVTIRGDRQLQQDKGSTCLTTINLLRRQNGVVGNLCLHQQKERRFLSLFNLPLKQVPSNLEFVGEDPKLRTKYCISPLNQPSTIWLFPHCIKVKIWNVCSTIRRVMPPIKPFCRPPQTDGNSFLSSLKIN